MSTGITTPASTESGLLRFPKDFLWGAATSHFQVEGVPQEFEKDMSDWSAWCREAGRISDNTTAHPACEFFKRYESDVELCRKLNLSAFRLGLNWPALVPNPPESTDGELKLDPDMVKFYRNVLMELKKAGTTTFVTLWHFTLPQWLSQAGGWNNTRTIDEFARFAEQAAKEFGDLVDYWITLNEPLAYVYQGYVSGAWPPGQKGHYLNAFRAVRSLLEGHARAYAVLKKYNPQTKVSFTMHWRPFMARQKWSPFDQMARFYRDFIFNHLFPNALKQGSLEFPFPISLSSDVRSVSGPIPGLKGTMDYIAVNYYTRERCEFQWKWPLDIFGTQTMEHEFEVNCMGWENYPEGLYNLLTKELLPFKYNLDGSLRDVVITENGYASAFPAELSDGDWSLADDLRVQYLTSHLQALHRAIRDGVNVKGYLYWSLTDNFEWAEGLRPRFGLVRIAYPTQERTLRKSAEIYANIAKHNALEMQTS